MTPTRTRTALVIGAGVSGPVAAMALRKAGIDPIVYEAHPASAQGVGTFLTIASNGIDALRAIGADDLALAVGFPTPAIALRSTTGKGLGGTLTGLILADGTTSHTLKRADLHQVLYQGAVRPAVREAASASRRGGRDTQDGCRPTHNPATAGHALAIALKILTALTHETFA